MLSASQALNLLSIFVPKKYKGLKQCKQEGSNVNDTWMGNWVSVMWGFPIYMGIDKIHTT